MSRIIKIKPKKIEESPMNYTVVPQRMDVSNRSVEQQVSDLKGKVTKDDTVEIDEKNFNENKTFTKKILEKKRIDNIFESGVIYSKGQLKNIFESLIRESINPNDPFTSFFIKCNDETFRKSYKIASERNELIARGEPYQNPSDLLELISTPAFQNEGWMQTVGKTFKMFGRKLPMDEKDVDIYRKIIIKAQQLPEGQWLANQINFFINNPGNKSLGQVSQQQDMGVVDQNAEKKEKFINQALINSIKDTFTNGINQSNNIKITDMLYQNVDNKTHILKQEELPCDPRLLLLWAALTNQEDIILLAKKHGGNLNFNMLTISGQLNFGGLGKNPKSYVINSKTTNLNTLRLLQNNNLITYEDVQNSVVWKQQMQQQKEIDAQQAREIEKQNKQPKQLNLFNNENTITKKEIVECIMRVMKEFK